VGSTGDAISGMPVVLGSLGAGRKGKPLSFSTRPVYNWFFPHDIVVSNT